MLFLLLFQPTATTNVKTNIQNGGRTVNVGGSRLGFRGNGAGPPVLVDVYYSVAGRHVRHLGRSAESLRRHEADRHRTLIRRAAAVSTRVRSLLSFAYSSPPYSFTSSRSHSFHFHSFQRQLRRQQSINVNWLVFCDYDFKNREMRL